MDVLSPKFRGTSSPSFRAKVTCCCWGSSVSFVDLWFPKKVRDSCEPTAPCVNKKINSVVKAIPPGKEADTVLSAWEVWGSGGDPGDPEVVVGFEMLKRLCALKGGYFEICIPI